MSLSRRKFLKGSIAFLGSALLMYALVKGRLRYLLNQLINNDIKIQAFSPAPLNQHDLDTLLAVTQTLVDTNIEKSHYEIYFEWRASNISGYSKLYKDFVIQVDQKAQKHQNKKFKDLNSMQQKDILSIILPNNLVEQFVKKLFNNDQLIYYNFIAKEILTLFSRTDAWILLGYKHWPGQARGFDEYRIPRKG